MQHEGSGLVQHEQVDASYLERRKLKRSARLDSPLGLGVGAVISGDYAGWNNGLTQGGFWGLAIATLLMGAMYFCMVFSIAELSAALPHAGGFASFTRNAVGPFGAFVCGITNSIEYIVTPAVIVFYIGGYMQKLIPGVPDYVWWLCFYGVFVGINVYGVALTLRVSLVMTLIAVIVLTVFYVSSFASDSFHIANLFNVAADPGQSAKWLPKGWHGVFVSLPFAIWFFLAIEELPLAAEEAHQRGERRSQSVDLGHRYAHDLGAVYARDEHRRWRSGKNGQIDCCIGGRFSSDFRQGHDNHSDDARGLDGPDCELPQHHLRLRSNSLRPFAGGIPAALDQRYEPEPYAAYCA